jgi:hypothetical protein
MYSIRDIAIGGAATFVATQVLPIQFKHLWSQWTEASDLAGRAYRGLEAVRDSLGGIPFGATFCGRPGLYNAIKRAKREADKRLQFADDLFPLRHPAFEKELAQEVAWTMGSIDYGLTTLMQQTASSGEDIRTPGTPAYLAAEKYLEGLKTVRIPELTRVMGRLRLIQSPWGVCLRDCIRFGKRFLTLARMRPGEGKVPPAPFAPGQDPTRRRRRRRTLPKVGVSTSVAGMSH